MADILRDLGNAAAHADDTNFPEDIVSSMIDFTQIILDYVYNLPEKLSVVQERIGKKKTTSEELPEKSTEEATADA
jgi:signal recognition particle subunit SEC65